jgi:hypothetical protein
MNPTIVYPLTHARSRIIKRITKMVHSLFGLSFQNIQPGNGSLCFLKLLSETICEAIP